MGTGSLRGGAIGAMALAGLLHGTAAAGVLAIDNGVAGPGHVDIEVDDYGAFGNWFGASNNDNFQVAGTVTASYATFLSGAYFFVRTMATVDPPAVLLTEENRWHRLVEPIGPADGIAGTPALSRVLTMASQPISTNALQSAFAIADAGGSGIQIAVALQQTLTYDALTNSTRLDQAYTITNTGTVEIEIALHSVWDTDLMWDGSYNNDAIGVGQGLCYVYATEPSGEPDRRVALSDGGSSVPFSYYYAAKLTQDPPTGPPFETTNGHVTFDSRGMPASWRNYASGLGYDTAGEFGTGNDAVLGIEYYVQLAVGGPPVTITTRRTYGTSTLPCATATCGNGTLEGQESCDVGGTDTATCNAATCTLAACGDGYVNAVAGEACDTGLDTAACNSATCTLAACGDGYVNAAAGEVCDSAGTDSSTCNGTTCAAAACGDGYVNAAAGEACDSAGADSSTCNGLACTLAACGDGYLNVAAGEACEETQDTATCNAATCTVAACGDGYLNAVAGETCDDGVDSVTCNGATCTPAACGDGYVNAAAGEACDDGADSATCNGATCTPAVCGDGYLNAVAGETCDDGVDSATCNKATCTPAMCGDGYVNVAADEECEAGALCDVATCKVAYVLGGGCAGCATGGERSSWWLAGLVALALLRRRRA